MSPDPSLPRIPNEESHSTIKPSLKRKWKILKASKISSNYASLGQWKMSKFLNSSNSIKETKFWNSLTIRVAIKKILAKKQALGMLCIGSSGRSFISSQNSQLPNSKNFYLLLTHLFPYSQWKNGFLVFKRTINLLFQLFHLGEVAMQLQGVAQLAYNHGLHPEIIGRKLYYYTEL